MTCLIAKKTQCTLTILKIGLLRIAVHTVIPERGSSENVVHTVLARLEQHLPDLILISVHRSLSDLTPTCPT